MHRKKERGFKTSSKGNIKCVVQSCKLNHPPWLCDKFKALPVTNQKMLIEKSKRCYWCLGFDHNVAECTRSRRCGVNGCDSIQHNKGAPGKPELHSNATSQMAETTDLPQNGRSLQNVKEAGQSTEVGVHRIMFFIAGRIPDLPNNWEKSGRIPVFWMKSSHLSQINQLLPKLGLDWEEKN